MPRFDPATRNNVIDRFQDGLYKTEISRHLSVHQSTISSPWQILYQTGSVQYCPRSGRPCTTNTAQDRYIRVFHLCRLTVTATTTAAGIPGLLSIFVQTNRNRLRQHKVRPSWTIFTLALQLILPEFRPPLNGSFNMKLCRAI